MDDHLDINREDNVALDEATGTPPFVSAKVRTIIYVGSLIVDVLSFLVLHILAVMGVMERAVAMELGYYILSAVTMVSAGLATGYRPTRPGSPINPGA